jgi:16S rRNA (uracil1498-N3)-methyltransferase
LAYWFGAAAPADSTQLVLAPGTAQPLTGIDSPGTKLCLLVGPEGGLSDSELADAAIAGFRRVSLGPRVLRTETAALAALAIAQATWGDLR